MKRQIIVYRDTLLSYSETFIPAQVENLSCYTSLYVGLVRSPGSESPILNKKSIVLSETLPFAKLWRILFKLCGIAHPKWLQLIQAQSPSLLHAHFGPDGVWALPLARRLGIPLIVTFYGYDLTEEQSSTSSKHNYGYQHTLYLKRRPQLFKEARVCLAYSNSLRSQLLEKGCPEGKALLHYVGVDVNKFTPASQVQREKVVLFVGRLVEKKGCALLIRAMAEIQAEVPEFKLIVIGDGPLRLKLEELARKLKCCCSFLGIQPSHVVQNWMNRACLLSAPSVTASTGDSEGLPTVLLEAQAMGLPVISSVHAGIPEAVIHKETGFLIQEGDWQALAEYLLILIQNVQLRERFAIAGRKRVEEKFNLRHNTAKLEEIYSSILDRN